MDDDRLQLCRSIHHKTLALKQYQPTSTPATAAIGRRPIHRRLGLDPEATNQLKGGILEGPHVIPSPAAMGSALVLLMAKVKQEIELRRGRGWEAFPRSCEGISRYPRALSTEKGETLSNGHPWFDGLSTGANMYDTTSHYPVSEK